jgi:hypothetical protein
MESPAEQAGMITGGHGGRHLQTTMALNSVKILFVAGPAVQELLAHPVAYLDCGVLAGADEAILLAAEDSDAVGVHGDG